MHKLHKFTICFADISICFQFPSEVNIPKEFEEFLVDNEEKADVVFEICLLDQPLHLYGIPDDSYMGVEVYHTEEGILRNYTPFMAENGCQVACL